VGIDVSKSDLQVLMLAERQDRSTKTVASRKFSNTATGHRDLKKWVDQRVKVREAQLLFLMEVTGSYHENILYFLYENGYSAHLELGKRTKAFMKSEGYKSKTDQIDARGLALMMLQKQFEPWTPASKEILSIRQILRLRRDLVQQRARHLNQLHAHQAGYLKDPLVKATLKKMILSHTKQVDLLWKKALELLKKDPELHQHVKRIVESVHGLGILTVLEVLSETNGFQTFSSIKQLVSYAGYDVIEDQSGKYRGPTRISKQGNERLRTSMYMAARSHINGKKGPVYQLYERLMERNGGIYKKAAVAVQRKLLALIYTLWKNQTAYDPEYHLKQKEVALTS
jgi:transposase